MDAVERKWEPGHVAQVKRGPSWEGRALYTLNGWIDQGGDPDHHPPLFDVTTARPLVVLDPESREDAERLVNAYRGHWLGESTRSSSPAQIDAMQAALRELADPRPSKPGEPSGLAAAVRYEGSLWVSVGRHCWLEIPGDEPVRPRQWHWEDFDSTVEVLRDEGWTS